MFFKNKHSEDTEDQLIKVKPVGYVSMTVVCINGGLGPLFFAIF